MLVFASIAIEVLLLILYYILGFNTIDTGLQIGCIILVAVYAFIFIYHSQKGELRNCWAKPSNLFVAGFLIVYYQFLLDYLLGYKTASSFLDPTIVNFATLISTVGFISFVVAYVRKPIAINNTKVIPVVPKLNVLVVFQIVFFVLFVKSIDVLKFITGADAYDPASSASMDYEYAFQAVNIVLLMTVCFQNRDKSLSLWGVIKNIPLISIILIFLYLILRLLSGDRGPVIYTLLVIFYAYIYLARKRFRFIYILVFFVIGATFVSLLGIARSSDLDMSFSERMLSATNELKEDSRAGGESTLSPITKELAFSYLSYEVMVKGMLKDNDGFKNGAYQGVVLVNIIPYASGWLHKEFNLTRDETSSSYYATYKYLGTDPSWGLGTNCIGDFYMDWGIVGVLFCMYFVGLLFKWVDNLLFVKDKTYVTPAMLALAFCYASEAIYMPRSNITGLLKLFAFVLILFFVSKFFGKKKMYHTVYE